MTENVLIPLPGLQVPGNFPWCVGFVSLVDEQLKRLRATGHFLPPRFFGYYFQGRVPIAVGGSWTVALDETRPVSLLRCAIERFTQGRYRVASESRDEHPDFLLVHDRRDGACWLWSFAAGLRFVEAAEPTMDGWDDVEASKRLGP